MSALISTVSLTLDTTAKCCEGKAKMNYEWNMAGKYRIRRAALYIALIVAYVWAENVAF